MTELSKGAQALRDLAGLVSEELSIDGAEVMLEAADVLEAVARYRDISAKYRDAKIMDGVEEEPTAEGHLYACLVCADIAGSEFTEAAKAAREPSGNEVNNEQG